MGTIDFSLVLCTKGRDREVERFLGSLDEAAHSVSFELIVVDQNRDDRIRNVLSKFQFENLTYLSVEFSGLSRARNYGLRYVRGEYVAFPDDDCEYCRDLLQIASDFFASHRQCSGISGVHVESFDDRPKSGRDAVLNRFNVWMRSISFTLFFRSASLRDDLGNMKYFFDETLGVGSGTSWLSGEEIDYVLQMLRDGLQLISTQSIMVCHPYIDMSRPGESEKAYKYSRGRMRVLRKHGYSLIFEIVNVVYPLVKLCFHPKSRERRSFYYQQFKGRLDGIANR